MLGAVTVTHVPGVCLCCGLRLVSSLHCGLCPVLRSACAVDCV